MAYGAALLIFGILIMSHSVAASSDVEFKLITRDNLRGEIETDLSPDASNLNNTEYSFGNATVVILHGFDENHENNCMVSIRDAFLNTTECNVIMVNWWALAQGPHYDTAAKKSGIAADALATFLDALILQTDNSTIKDLHVVGFSLGAQVVGLAANRMKFGPLPRITALDPSKPIFEFKEDSERLSSDDAEFVLTIHTAGGFIAFGDPVGDADFYPNGGISPQPSCSHRESQNALICSHQMSCLLFSESLYSPMAFPATQCDSWSHFRKGECDGNTKAFMGAYTHASTRGSFFLKTNAVPPYGQESTFTDSVKYNISDEMSKKMDNSTASTGSKKNVPDSILPQVVLYFTPALLVSVCIYLLFNFKCHNNNHLPISLRYRRSKTSADSVESSYVETE